MSYSNSTHCDTELFDNQQLMSPLCVFNNATRWCTYCSRNTIPCKFQGGRHTSFKQGVTFIHYDFSNIISTIYFCLPCRDGNCPMIQSPDTELFSQPNGKVHYGLNWLKKYMNDYLCDTIINVHEIKQSKYLSNLNNNKMPVNAGIRKVITNKSGTVNETVSVDFVVEEKGLAEEDKIKERIDQLYEKLNDEKKKMKERELEKEKRKIFDKIIEQIKSLSHEDKKKILSLFIEEM